MIVQSHIYIESIKRLVADPAEKPGLAGTYAYVRKPDPFSPTLSVSTRLTSSYRDSTVAYRLGIPYAIYLRRTEANGTEYLYERAPRSASGRRYQQKPFLVENFELSHYKLKKTDKSEYTCMTYGVQRVIL